MIDTGLIDEVLEGSVDEVLVNGTEDDSEHPVYTVRVVVTTDAHWLPHAVTVMVDGSGAA